MSDNNFIRYKKSWEIVNKNGSLSHVTLSFFRYCIVISYYHLIVINHLKKLICCKHFFLNETIQKCNKNFNLFSMSLFQLSNINLQKYLQFVKAIELLKVDHEV